MAFLKHLTDLAPGIAGILCRRAAEEPEREAFRFLTQEGPAKTVTFGELDRRARSLAVLLRRHASLADRVLLLYPPGLDYIAAFFACLYAGTIAVPSYPPPRAASTRRNSVFAIAADSGPSVVLTTKKILEKSGTLREQLSVAAVWLAPDSGETALADEWRPPEEELSGTAFLQYTSGSTARPRGVMVSHGNLLANARQIDSAFRLTPEMTGVFWLPPYHDMGLIGGILQPVFSGFNAVLMPPGVFIQNPLLWLQAISEHRAAVSGGPNFGYELCARRVTAAQVETLDLSCWKVAFNGAEPVRAATLDRFAARLSPCGFRREAFQPCYGLAEATLLVSGSKKNSRPSTIALNPAALSENRVEQARTPSGSAVFVGCGEAGHGVRIVKPGGTEPCDRDEVGEILVCGANIAQGYWENTEETERVFGARISAIPSSFLRTGDLGFVAEGELFITGRLKDLIILRGRNYYPEDIEETVRNLPQFADLGCAALSLEDGVEAEARLLVLQECPRSLVNAEDAFAEIRKAVAAAHQLQVHTIALVAAHALPRTTSGKLQRGLCLRQFLENSLPVIASSRLADAEDGESPPKIAGAGIPESQGDVIILAEIIARRLGVRSADVDPRRPLETLGLDSLLSVQITMEVENRFGVALPPATFLENFTLEEVASRLSSAPRVAETIHVAPASDEMPLSYGQRALWFLHQLAPTAGAYNIARAFELRGRLPAETLRRALERVVARHPSLRARFVARDAETLQRFDGPASPEFEVVDGADWDDARLREELAQYARRPFSLETGPPLRVLLIERSADVRVLLVVVHHLVADRWSLEIVLREVAAFCRIEGGSEPAPAPSGEIAGYFAWQTEFLRSAEGDRQRTYWEDKLGRGLPVVNLAPGVRARTQTFNGARCTAEFSARTARNVAALARSENVTLYVVLSAVFSGLLSRYTGKTDLPTGMPVAGRSRAAFANVVGYLVNPVVIRADLSGRPSFHEVLRRQRRLVIEAVNHADYPFALLAQQLMPERDASYAPLFQVFFYLEGENDLREAFRGSGADIMPLEVDFHPAQFDLALRIEESGGLPLTASFDYNTDLLEAAAVERMAAHFFVMLEDLVAHPLLGLSQAALLTVAERRQMLVEWTGGAIDIPPLCVHQLFERQAERFPEADAILHGERRMSYGELNRRANALAWKLRSDGARPEERVAVCIERSAELIVALLAVLKSGAAYVPLDPAYPREFLALVLRESKAKMLVTQRKLFDRFPKLQTPAVCIEECDTLAEVPALQASVCPENLAYAIFTSGSTGTPKGVAIEHRNCVAMLQWARQALPLEDQGLMLAATSVCFDVSIYEIFMPLTSGGRLAMADNLLELPSLPVRDQVTALCGVPSGVAQLLSYSGLPAGISTVNLGGEALNAEVVKRMRAAGARRIFNLYGPTEDTTYSTFECVPEDEPGEPAIGRPVGGKKTWVLDAEMNLCPVGVTGELYLGGAGLSRGYLDQPAMTAEKFVPDPLSGNPGSRLYRVGDLGRRRADGRLEYLGRLDQQVKVRGFRIELEEIESALRRHPAIREAVVGVRRRANTEKQLIAWVVMRSRTDVRDLREFVRERLPEYMVPGRIVELESLPLNPNGKVDRLALPDPENMAPDEGDRSPVRGATEEAVAALWAEVLGGEVRGRETNFFELGGHSLMATQVVSRVRQIFGVELPLRALFENPTVAALSARIEATRAQGRGPGSVPAAVTRPPRIPLSYAQQRLWFLDQLAPGDPTYVIVSGVLMHGRLDRAALSQSLNQIVARHEVLRTHVEAHDGLPWQVIAERLEPELPGVDLQNMDLQSMDLQILREEEQEIEFRRRLREMGENGFDLARGPLIRACLLQLAEEKFCLALVLHHVAGDGWSMGVLLREMREFYEARLAGRAAELPPLKIQYADYAIWQRTWLQGGELERQFDYWREQLKDIEALRLPCDRPHPALRSGRGATLRWKLPAQMVAALRALGSRQGTTVFMIMLAAFQALLSRYSGQNDVTIGSVIANRNRREIEDLIGFFVNTLVLRGNVDRTRAFSVLLAHVRRVCLEAYAHQDVPFEKLVEALHPERDPARQPFFQAVLALQNAPLPAMEMGGMKLEPVAVETRRSRFDLSLMIEPFEAEWTVVAEYNTDIFDSATIERIGAHYRQLLREVTASPEAALADLEILSPQEREELSGWSRRGGDYREGMFLHGMFEEQVRRTPQATALVSETLRWSYAELNRRADRLARYLRELGVGPEVVVGVCLERSAEMMVCFLAVLKAGGVYLPLDAKFPPQRLGWMAEDSQALMVITSPELRESLKGVTARLIMIGEAMDHAASAHPMDGPRPPEPTADNLAYIIYTSGSTGRPRGVGISHRAVCPLIEWGQRTISLTADDRVLQYLAPGFDWSVWENMITLTSGASLHILAEKSPFNAERTIRREKITVLHATPSEAEALANSGFAFTSLRLVLAGGEKADGNTVACVRRLAGGECRIFNMYGPTESSIVAAACEVESDETALREMRESIPIGFPVAATVCHVLDAEMNVCPRGVPGELYLGGVQLARAYVGEAALTAAKFIPDRLAKQPASRLYRTGDIVRWLPDGRLDFLGRADSQIKVRGFRIELGEIESALRSHSSVREAAVAVRERAGGDKQIIAYLSYVSGAYVSGDAREAQELRAFLRERLPEYMLPARIIVLDSLPLTAGGKVNRKALPEPEDVDERGHAAPLRGATEEMVAAAWSSVLGVEIAGRDSNFFDLGGHSLLATQVISRIRQIFGVELPLRSMFEEPTLAMLCERIERLRGESREASIPPLTALARPENIPLSHAQQRLWFLEQIEPGGPAYVIAAAVRLCGPLDTGALERSLNRVIDRHEVLRTEISLKDGAPVQAVMERAELKLEQAGFETMEAAERVAAAREDLKQTARRGFDLSQCPLVRARLLRLEEREHWLLLSMHHIVSDGWSMGVLVRDLKEFYRFELQGGVSLPAPLAVQYADFASWQRAWMQGGELDRQLDYWREQLRDAEPLQLPTDRPYPEVRSGRGAALHFQMPAPLCQALRRTSRSQGVTLFMTLLAGWQALLARYTRQSDLVIGTAIANRNRQEVEPMIGFFVNTLLLRSEVTGDRCFHDLLARARETCLQAYAHQDLPFEKLVEALHPERDTGRQPLVQVMLALQNAPLPALELGELKLEPLPMDGENARFDLTVEVAHPEADAWMVSMEYNTDVFEVATIERLAGHFRRLLESAVALPEVRVAELEMLAESERRELEMWSGSAPGSSGEGRLCLHETFETRARLHPRAAAVHSGERVISYSELDRLANVLGRRLRAAGITPQAVVGLWGGPSVERVISHLAVLKAGACCLFLAHDDPEERVADILRNARAAFLLVPAGWKERLSLPAVTFIGVDVPVLDDLAEDDLAEDDLAENEATSAPKSPLMGVDSGQLAYLIYMSRTRGLAFSHRDLLRLIAPVPEGDAKSKPSVLSFAGDRPSLIFLSEMWGALLHGGTFTVSAESDSGSSTNTPPPASTTWKPFGDTRTWVLDSHGKLLPVGVPGELHAAAAAALAEGYHRHPDVTAEHFIPDALSGVSGGRLFKSGALARRLASGELQQMGRTDGLLEVYGSRIDPGEIETLLRRHSTIREAVVTSFEDGAESQLVVYAVPTGNLRPDRAELQTWLAARLPQHMVPGELVWLDRLPLNSRGRLDRAKLPDPRTAAQRSLGLVQPRTPTEIAIAEIWNEVLARGGIGVHENFFDVDGTSLQVVLVVTKLRTAFSRPHLPVTALFAHPTIAAMAEYLERDRTTVAAAAGANAETRRQAIQRQQELRLRVRSLGSEGP